MAFDGRDSVGRQQRDVKRIFAEVCDLAREARPNRLDELCGSDLQLRRAVERLLQHDVADSIFENDSTENEAPGNVSRFRVMNVPPPDE